VILPSQLVLSTPDARLRENIFAILTGMEQTPETELAACLSMISQSELAKLSGESKQAVSDMVNGRRTISAKMLDFLGFKRVVIIRPKRGRPRKGQQN
jgi:hypothetical protein